MREGRKCACLSLKLSRCHRQAFGFARRGVVGELLNARAFKITEYPSCDFKRIGTANPTIFPKFDDVEPTFTQFDASHEILLPLKLLGQLNLRQLRLLPHLD